MINQQNESDILISWREVRNAVDSAAIDSGRNPEDVLLVAVSKTYSYDKIKLLYDAGHRNFGENKVQELVPKMEEGAGDVVWHMIGGLQTNKIKYIAPRVDWIHSVAKIKALHEIEKRAGDAQRVINVLVQVNISEEDQKSGCEPDELKELLLESRGFKHVLVRGLMGMASFEEDAELVRPQFKMLRELRDLYKNFNEGALLLEHLSMGMTHDMEVAIEEGATIVRIGSAIFGERH